MPQVPYTPHQVQKAQAFVDYTGGLVEDQLSIPKLMTREGFLNFKGRDGDKLTYRVPGRLPYRRYAWRNDRSNPIIFDVYKEGKTDITVGDRLYSGVQVTDEQHEYDLNGEWGKLANAQATAVVQGYQDAATKALENAPYAVTIGLNGSTDLGVVKRAMFEAKRVLDNFRVPRGERFCVVGSGVAMLLLEMVVKNSADRAEGALADAKIGRIAGFDVFEDNIADDEAYFFVPNAFVLFQAAAYVPESAGFGRTVSAGGTNLRWIRSYDHDHFMDRSSFDGYVSTAPVKDIFFEKSVYTESPTAVTLDTPTTQHFVRGLKLKLTGTSVYPAANSEIAAETGVSAAKAFVATP